MNKVRYNIYDWQILRTAHFDIYYDAPNRLLAEYAAKIAEYAHAKISSSLEFELTHTVPIFIYNGHNDFENSNLTFETLTEGVGGFTEVFKSRVAVPFPGSYGEFRHVLTHEITHAFQYNILYGDFWESLLMRPFMYSAPLWFMEGLAEFESQTNDILLDLMQRDAVLNDMMPGIPELDNLSSLAGYKYFFIYKGGQSFLYWIAQTYGEESIGRIFKLFRSTKDINSSFQSIIGKGLQDLNREWLLFLDRKYLPAIEHERLWDQEFHFITRHFEDNSFRNSTPVWSKDGSRVMFFTDARQVSEIVSVSVAETIDRKILVSGNQDVHFEELHVNENRMSLSSNGRCMLFISKSGKSDRINLFDIKRKRLVEKITPEVDKIFSAAFSPDESDIVFSAIRNGRTDLYVYSRRTKETSRLFNDEYIDYLPFWGRDGYIYFVSNRDKSIWSSQYDIFRVIPGEDPETVVSSPWKDTMPELSPNGTNLVFVSYRNGIPNLFLHNLETKNIYQLTDVTGAALAPSWSPDGGKIVFTLHNRLGQDVVTLSATNRVAQKNSLRGGMASATNYFNNIPSTAYDSEENRFLKTKLDFSPDWVNMALAFSQPYGFGGFLEMIISDMMGDHQVFFKSNFLSDDFNFNLSYLYQKYRLNFGLGVFNQKDYYYYNVDIADEITYDLYYKKELGGMLYLQYPFSRFFRLDLKFNVLNYREFFEAGSPDNVEAGVMSPAIILSFDNAVYNGTFYTRGMRFWSIYEYAVPAGKNFWEYQKFIFDHRWYIPVGRRTALAERAVFASIWGPDAENNPFYIGGMDSVRGYNYDVFSSYNMALLKFEYRFPFVDLIRLSWPVPFLIKNMTGLFFWDFGAVWDRSDNTQFAYVKGDTVYFDALKSGAGIGLRLQFLYFKIILDYAAPFNGHRLVPKEWRTYFSIGYDF